MSKLIVAAVGIIVLLIAASVLSKVMHALFNLGQSSRGRSSSNRWNRNNPMNINDPMNPNNPMNINNPMNPNSPLNINNPMNPNNPNNPARRAQQPPPPRRRP